MNAAQLQERVRARAARAEAIVRAGGIEAALSGGALPRVLDLTVSEALVLGLLRQGVHTYVGVFGHGTTDLGEALRSYAEAGLVRVVNVRSEIEASHAATALRWQHGEPAAVFTSIGPGALQALAASLVPASNSIGLYYLFGDETTEDEGPNMQQVPRHQQMGFLKLASAMGEAYTLQTGWALSAALRRGASTVHHPVRPQPFYLLLPMNTQPEQLTGYNLAELPRRPTFPACAPADAGPFQEAAARLSAAARVVVKVGGGARGVAPAVLDELLRRADAAYVHGPVAVGLLPGSHPRNMTVGGSKGSTCGNAAMREADLVVTIGARAVCQWDCSGTAWKAARSFIAVNTDPEDAAHYNSSLHLIGDAGAVLERLVQALREAGVDKGARETPWSSICSRRRREWDEFLASRIAVGSLHDEQLGRPLLTQPAAIAAVVQFAREVEAVKYFDAGDVQANGFQLIEDDRPGLTVTDTGASYMGFASGALLAGALAAQGPRAYPIAFTGDGSFMMSPQILIDAVQNGLHGMIVLFDNRKMAAIESLQRAQYGHEFATADGVAVDYAAMAEAVRGVRGFHGGYDVPSLRRALEAGHRHKGLSLVHVPVYSGPDERGGLGAYGDWNVGNWCEDVQRERYRLGL
jgi:3D-(3,5/4)-trihydroxycyclohexane-1,2-dione acylhydrolase (decyclizing)